VTDADPVDIARSHLERRAAEERDTECAECGARNPPTRTTPDGTLVHDACDRADALWPPVVRPYGSRSCLGPEDSDAVCRELIGAAAEIEELDALARRQGELLRAVAGALKGPPPAGTMHSVHDLHEVAARLRALLAGSPTPPSDDELSDESATWLVTAPHAAGYRVSVLTSEAARVYRGRARGSHVWHRWDEALGCPIPREPGAAAAIRSELDRAAAEAIVASEVDDVC
jgi:hypothetical protein